MVAVLVCQLEHGLNWNVSTTIGWTDIKGAFRIAYFCFLLLKFWILKYDGEVCQLELMKKISWNSWDNRLSLGWVLSFSILWAFRRHLTKISDVQTKKLGTNNDLMVLITCRRAFLSCRCCYFRRILTAGLLHATEDFYSDLLIPLP